MRSVALCILASWFCVTGLAYASTGSSAPLAQNYSSNVREGRTGSSPVKPLKPAQKKAVKSLAQPIASDQAATRVQEATPAVETIKSLVSGSAPVNPWFPERGAIGVRVKVTW